MSNNKATHTKEKVDLSIEDIGTNKTERRAGLSVNLNININLGD